MQIRILALACSFLMLGACASSAPKPVEALDSVNAAYQEASTDDVILQHASLELSDAKDQLAKANQLWEAGEKRTDVEAQASVAQARIDYAESQARLRQETLESNRADLEQRQAAIDAKEQQVAENQRATEALKYQLLELETKKTERGLQLTMENDLFEPAETQMTGDAYKKVKKIAVFLRDNPERTILIEGHSDSAGDPDWGFDLSAGRAGEVGAALTDEGISIRRIKINAFGGANPIASNDSEEGRMKNRRVEVIFPQSPEAAAAHSN